ncbi:MAG TPA: CPBP family intramembrane glutamic endopeptidase [Candidatus Dormibacteraeota bacterium]
MLIDIFMEEVTYRGVMLEALDRFDPTSRVLISAVLFGFSHLDNLLLPGADWLGVAYQVFEAMLVGILFAARAPGRWSPSGLAPTTRPWEARGSARGG